MASSTTMPGATGTRYCSVLPPWRSPRKTSKIASAISLPPLPGARRLCFLGQNLLQLLGHNGNGLLAKGHGPTLRGDDVVLPSPGGGVQRRIIDAAVCSAAFAACQSAARNGFRNCEHRF